MNIKKGWLMVTIMAIGIGGGCNSLRFAPGERQKQNAYLHHRTVQAAAITAENEKTSPTLQKLTGRATQQSEAIMAYYGLPREIPASGGAEELLSTKNETITQSARAAAIQRPDPWDVADHLLELGIALTGVLGGVVGGRVIGGLTLAKQKSHALREIIRGNELFKQNNPLSVDNFKEAQQSQSDDTRQLVAAMK